MYKKALVCLGIPLFLTGCAGVLATTDVSPENESNVIDFSRSIVIGMSNKLDKIVVRRHNSEEDHGNFRTFYSAFFPVNGGATGVIQSYRNYCSKIGGVLKVNQTVACFSPSDLNHPLFHVKITGKYSQGARSTRIFIDVSEPKNLQLKNDPNYIAHITEQGFLNEKNSQNLATKKHNEQLAKQIMEQNILREEQKFVTMVGTQICQAGRGYTYFLGYVDQYQNGKIKILVNGAYSRGNNYMLGGFTPRVIWDYPQNWRLCTTFQ